MADARCVWSRRHAPPRRWCGCGFYCLYHLADARALGCATENQAALLLQVTASGRYIRYERGVRSSRQRVRAVVGARCACGGPAPALADAASGLVGWRRLTPVCGACAAGSPVLTLTEFAARLDGSVQVLPPHGAAGLGDVPAAPSQAAPARTSQARTSQARTGESARDAADSAVALLSAEVALLHARLDDLQARLGPPR